MMSSLQMCCWSFHIDCLWQHWCERAGNRGTCCICMEELWRLLKRLNLCCILVNAEITLYFSWRHPLFLRVWGVPSAALLCFGVAELSSAAGWVQLQCPHRLYDSAQCCWRCSSKVVSDCITAGTDAEPRALRSHGADFYYVDVTGLPPTLPCPVANLLCQITGDNSDAIGGQLCFLTSGSAVQQ